MQNRFPADIILLAAGLGTRMLPLTEQRPKPLIKVGGIALMDRVIANCLAEGGAHFIINAHHHLEQMHAHILALPARFPEASFAISEEPQNLLDTGGGAKKAMALTKSDPVLVINTDAFWLEASDKPLQRMFAQYEATPDIVLLCAQPARATGFRRSHDFCLAPDKLITNDRGAPIIYAGAALIPRSHFESAPEGAFSLLDMIYKAQEQNQLHGVMLDAPWLHVGDPEALEQAEHALAKGLA